MAKKGSKRRHFGRRLKHRVKAAKPSVAIVAGLAIPPVLVLSGQTNLGPGRFTTDPVQLIARVKAVYLGAQVPTVSTIVQSTAVKSAAFGFIAHYIANLTGANRYLARMKWPFRI